MISRLLYDKGYCQYVEAAKHIKRSYPEIDFLLLGDLDFEYPNHVQKDMLEQDISSGAIRYLGYNEDVRRIINMSDCIVLPSFYNEGLSRVLMEALAMSKPIITSDIPGCKETVDDGKNGFLCKPKDSQSLIHAIEKFISLDADQRIAFGKNGRKKAEDIFDIKHVIEAYHNITKDIL